MALRKTRAELLTAVRSNLDEATASFWSDTELYNFINRAKDKVWIEVRKLKADFFVKNLDTDDGSVTLHGESFDTSTLAISVGGTEITLPHDFHEMKYIEVTTSGYEDVRFYHRDITHPDFRAKRALTDNQTPTHFYFDVYGERTLIYTPKSSVALNLRIFYVFKPADVDGSTSLDMPDPLYLAVEEYATTRAQLKDRDETAAVWQQMGNKTVLDCLGAMTRQIQDPVMVLDAGPW